ncbi:MAG: hypothetical protein C5S48_05100 [Candidatus Methanogaster sp.]|nr:MAG: hypothetical protein C5S48_05100 [ANME-2 cluster archaeon]
MSLHGLPQEPKTPRLVPCIAILRADVAKSELWLRPGHQILVEVYRVLKTGDRYQDAGAEAVTERRLKNREQRMVRELKRCGYNVSKVVA